jgi:hypothetical protein
MIALVRIGLALIVLKIGFAILRSRPVETGDN